MIEVYQATTSENFVIFTPETGIICVGYPHGSENGKRIQGKTVVVNLDMLLSSQSGRDLIAEISKYICRRSDEIVIKR